MLSPSLPPLLPLSIFPSIPPWPSPLITSSPPTVPLTSSHMPSFSSPSSPALLFTLAGFAQMAQWALGKHRNYRKEFSKYPRGRKAILPFLI